MVSDIGTYSTAEDISADGLFVIGHDGRWTKSGGWQDLGIWSNGVNSKSFAISGDGSTVVGEGEPESQDENNWYEAFRWTEVEGIEGLGYLSDSRFYGQN